MELSAYQSAVAAILRGPDQQASDIRSSADANGHEIDQVHIAIDESAGHGAHPAVEAAKARGLTGVSDGCVSAYLSRFARKVYTGSKPWMNS